MVVILFHRFVFWLQTVAFRFKSALVILVIPSSFLLHPTGHREVAMGQTKAPSPHPQKNKNAWVGSLRTSSTKSRALGHFGAAKCSAGKDQSALHRHPL